MDAKPSIWLTGEEHTIGRRAATRCRYRTLHGSALSPYPHCGLLADRGRLHRERRTARFGALLRPPPITEDGPPRGLAVSVPGWDATVAIWHLAYWGSAILAGLLLTELIWG